MNLFARSSPPLRYRNRSVRLTSEGVLFLFLTLLVGITALNTGNNLLYLLMALMLTLILISGILSEWCLKKLEVEHRLPPHIFAQEPTACRWLLRNKKSFSPAFLIKTGVLYTEKGLDHGITVPRILAGATHLQSATLMFGHRGIFQSRGYEVSTSFPFGFFEKSLTLPSSSEVVVYPRLHRLWIVEGDTLLPGGDREVRKKGQGPALHNVRDYQHGDNPRDIHWKISARHAKLFVKEHEKDDEPKAHIWLSNHLPIYPSSSQIQDFEEAISLAASLVLAFTRKGYEVGLSTFDRDIPSRRGMNHCYRILQHLALLKPIPRDPPGKNTIPLAGRLYQRPQQAILILPWEDPFWKAKQAWFTRIVTPAQWKQQAEQEENV